MARFQKLFEFEMTISLKYICKIFINIGYKNLPNYFIISRIIHIFFTIDT